MEGVPGMTPAQLRAPPAEVRSILVSIETDLFTGHFQIGNNFFGLAAPPAAPAQAFLSLPSVLPTPMAGALHYPSQDPSRMGAQMANHPPPAPPQH